MGRSEDFWYGFGKYILRELFNVWGFHPDHVFAYNRDKYRDADDGFQRAEELMKKEAWLCR